MYPEFKSADSVLGLTIQGETEWLRKEETPSGHERRRTCSTAERSTPRAPPSPAALRGRLTEVGSTNRGRLQGNSTVT